MTVVRSVAVQNMYGASTAPFWPAGGKALNVEFGADSDGTCSVRGVDPENNNEVVFSGVIRTAQQDRFIEAVRAGRPGTLLGNENAPVGYPSPAQLGADHGRAWYLVPLVSVASGAADNGNLPFTASPPASRPGTPEPPASSPAPHAGRSGLSADVALADDPDDHAVVISGGDPHPP